MITSSSNTSSARSSVRGSPRSNVSTWASSGLLAEVEADHVVDVGVGELVVGDAGAEAVDQLQRCRPLRPDGAARRPRSRPRRRSCGGRPRRPARRRGGAGRRAPRGRPARRAATPSCSASQRVLPVGRVVRPVGEHDHAAGAEHAPQRVARCRRSGAGAPPAGDRAGAASPRAPPASSRCRSACARCPRARATRPSPSRTMSSPAIPIQTPSRGPRPCIAGSKRLRAVEHALRGRRPRPRSAARRRRRRRTR